MGNTNLKAEIQKAVKKHGPKRVSVALFSYGVGLSTTEKLVRGSYGPTPRGATAWGIERALEELKKEAKAS